VFLQDVTHPSTDHARAQCCLASVTGQDRRSQRGTAGHIQNLQKTHRPPTQPTKRPTRRAKGCNRSSRAIKKSTFTLYSNRERALKPSRYIANARTPTL
jgi:hypothetical protein